MITLVLPFKTSFETLKIFETPKLKKIHEITNISASSDRRNMIYSSLDSPHRGASNGGKIMILASIDDEIFQHFQFIRFLKVACHLSMLES